MPHGMCTPHFEMGPVMAQLYYCYGPHCRNGSSTYHGLMSCLITWFWFLLKICVFIYALLIFPYCPYCHNSPNSPKLQSHVNMLTNAVVIFLKTWNWPLAFAINSEKILLCVIFENLHSICVFCLQSNQIKYQPICLQICPEFIKLYVKSYTDENTPSQYISTHFEEEDPTAITNGLL